MQSSNTSAEGLLNRRLMPLAYALAAVIGLIMLSTWLALQLQVTLAGLLNGESVWSKAQKQLVIDLDAYASHGRVKDLDRYRSNNAILRWDRWARDQILSGRYDHEAVAQAFRHGVVMPSAISGLIFLFDYFPNMPYMRESIAAWRSTDAGLDELERLSGTIEQSWATGAPSREWVAQTRSRIAAINDRIEPRAKLFSLEIARGAEWIGRILFGSVLFAACVASLVWFLIARRILAGVRGSEERYRLLFDSATDAIVMVDEHEGTILDANRTAARWSGRNVADLIHHPFSELFASPVHNGGGSFRGPEGLRPVEMQSSLVSWGTQPVRQAIIRDIAERVAMEQERRIAAEALASVAEGVVIADAGRVVVSANAAYTAMTGFDPRTMQRQRFDDTRTLPDGAPLPSSVWSTIAAGGNWQGEVVSRRSDGSSYPEQVSISAIRDADGRVQRYVAVFTNISAIKANQLRLEYLATRDTLTHLSNRSEFERLCDDAIQQAMRRRQELAVLFVDLDAFKMINDSYSHAIGDRLLAKVAERIVEQIGPGDVAGRIGGDEFTVLVTRLDSLGEVAALATRLLTALARPIQIDDHELVLSASIGIAGYPLDGTDTTALIANADAAMYVAKTEERNAYRFYTPAMQAKARRRLALLVDLRRALENGEFRLVFQPSVEVRSSRIVAVEALLRWTHPERGPISPVDFIPMAEQLGLIRRIDEWVLHAACAQMHAWDEAGVPAIRVAVNVSASGFGSSGFVDSVRRHLAKFRIDPIRLMLEITEGTLLRLGEDVERTLRELHMLGVGVAIDDFGTGYSSLTYLKLPAIAYLKIDRSFVSGLPGSPGDAAIIEAVLALARKLNLTPIAEGVETEGQHDFLAKAGCPEAQGFLYAHPLEASEIDRLLRRRNEHGMARLRLVPPIRR